MLLPAYLCHVGRSLGTEVEAKLSEGLRQTSSACQGMLVPSVEYLCHVGGGLGTEVEAQLGEGLRQAALQVLLDVGRLARASGPHHQAVLVAAHQLIQQEGVAHCVHRGHNDVGVLCFRGDGGGVQEVGPGDPLDSGLVEGEGIDGLAVWEELGDLDWRCLCIAGHSDNRQLRPGGMILTLTGGWWYAAHGEAVCIGKPGYIDITMTWVIYTTNIWQTGTSCARCCGTCVMQFAI